MLVVEVMPAPDSPTVSGLLLALLFTVRVPEFVAAVGVNLTVTVQVPLTASVVQLLVWLKAPVTATLETVAAVVPVLVTVTVCVGGEDPTRVAGKERLAGEALSTGPGAVPVPDRLTVLVTPPALMGTLPVLAPAAIGEYVTLTVQELFAAIDEPQLLVSAKGPLAVMDETGEAALVGLAAVTVWAALVLPTTVGLNVSAVGLALTPVTGYGGGTGGGETPPRHPGRAVPGVPPASVAGGVARVGLGHAGRRDVGGRGRAAGLFLQGERTGADDGHVAQVDVGDRALDPLNRLERALLDQRVGHVDRARTPALAAVEPQRADAELPVRVEAAVPDHGVVGDGGQPDRGGAEALPHVDAAALGDAGVDDQVAGHGVVVAAVDRDPVGELLELHRVVGDRVAGVGPDAGVGPGRDAAVTGVADVAVGYGGVGDAAMEVDAVRGGVADAHAAEGQARHRPVHPGADLHVLNPDVRHGRVAHGPADAVDLGAVVPHLHVAEDREVRQVHAGARVRRGVPVEAGGRAGDGRVPHARACDGHVVDDDVAGDVVRARRDPDRAAGPGRGDRGVEGVGRVGRAGRGGALADDGHRA